jgi:hypothetical protein
MLRRMVKPTALLVALGTFLTVVATPLLMTAGFLELTNVSRYSSSSAATVLSVAGWGALGVGATMLSVGLHQLVSARVRATVVDAR